jgi:hypothetical protein
MGYFASTSPSMQRLCMHSVSGITRDEQTRYAVLLRWWSSACGNVGLLVQAACRGMAFIFYQKTQQLSKQSCGVAAGPDNPNSYYRLVVYVIGLGAKHPAGKVVLAAHRVAVRSITVVRRSACHVHGA